MQILFRELKASIRSLFFWYLGIALFIFMAISEFSAYYNNPDMEELLSVMPQNILEAFSISSVNLTTLSGFVSIITTYLVIILGVQGALLGSSILVKEEREKTAEFLYSLPINRGSSIVQKIIAGIIQSVLILFLSIITLVFLSVKYEPNKEFIEFIILSAGSIFIIQILFFSIGLLVSVTIKNYKKANGITIGIVLGLYIMSVFQGLSEDLEFLKYITPFKYFESHSLLKNGELITRNVIICLSLITVSFILTILIYPKKDLQI